MSRRNRFGFDDPSVILTGGPSHSRAAQDDDPPYVPPSLQLGFTAPPAVPRALDRRVQQRIDDLIDRGLARMVADDLRRHGSDEMLDQLERATDAELLEVNALHEQRAALHQVAHHGGYLVSTPRDMPRGVLAEIRAEAGPLLWDGDQA